jgi:hypothetical protein
MRWPPDPQAGCSPEPGRASIAVESKRLHTSVFWSIDPGELPSERVLFPLSTAAPRPDDD